MKLATKLALAISAVFALVLMLSSALIATDEIRFVDQQAARHGRLLARVVATTVEQTWREHGEADALDQLREIDEHEYLVVVRWVSLDPNQDHHLADPRVDSLMREGLRSGDVVTVVGGSEEDTLFTYAPLSIDGDANGYERAIEIGQSLASLNHHVRDIQLLLFGVGLVGFGTSTLVAYLLGRRYVTRPVAELIAMARRVGQRDYSEPASESSVDELGVLAREMNDMSAELAAAEHHARELEEARLHAQQQLEHAERLATVGQLAAGVAHEIGTPLQAISLRANLIAARAGHVEGIAEFTHAIEVQSRRVADIVRNLLSFARRRPPRSLRRDLGEVVEDAVALIEAAHPSARIERELAPDPLLADADAEQLGHVITNLLVNGMHAMPEGGRLRVGTAKGVVQPPPEVGAYAAEYGRLWVEDEGHGIPDDVLPHLFEPFFTTKPPGEGTGLGLSIVYGIVKEHGGWIDVKTRPGEGTRFTVYLPLADPEPASAPAPGQE